MQVLVRWLQRIGVVVAAFGLAYLFVVMIQPYRFREVLAEKRGRVVDAKSGQGIADVAVLVNYRGIYENPLRASSACIHQKIVRTDADGFYRVPSAAADIDVADDMLRRMLLGFSERFTFSIAYLKPGYMEDQQVEAFVSGVDERFGRGMIWHLERRSERRGSDGAPPAARLRRIDLDDHGAVADAYLTYLGRFRYEARCIFPGGPESEQFAAFLADIERSARRLICDLPLRRPMAESTRREWFLDCSATAYLKNMRQILGDPLLVTAGDLCQSYAYQATDDECSDGSFKPKPLVVSTKLQERPFNGAPRVEHVRGEAPCPAGEGCERRGTRHGAAGRETIRGEAPSKAK